MVSQVSVGSIITLEVRHESEQQPHTEAFHLICQTEVTHFEQVLTAKTVFYIFKKSKLVHIYITG